MIYGKHNFDNRLVHIVQIGLGTNSTFIQNFANSCDWDERLEWILQIVKPCRHGDCKSIAGVAVEPVSEHVKALMPWVKKLLPRVALVQQAIGEEDGYRMLFMLPKQQHQALLNAVHSSRRRGLEWSLSYLLNMSCVGQEHPDMQYYLNKIEYNYGVHVRLKQVTVGMWTWSTLVQKLNFKGCKVLVVDAEGFDVSILRSMIEYCSSCETKSSPWPHVIQFETQGHCDKLEGVGAEWGIITALQNAGYTLVHYSHYNTHLARTSKLSHKGRVKYWAGSLICSRCWKRHRYPYLTSRIDWNIYCFACARGSRYRH